MKTFLPKSYEIPVEDRRKEALINKARKGDKSAVWALQSFYGMDLDYSVGADDGEEPEIRIK